MGAELIVVIVVAGVSGIVSIVSGITAACTYSRYKKENKESLSKETDVDIENEYITKIIRVNGDSKETTKRQKIKLKNAKDFNQFNSESAKIHEENTAANIAAAGASNALSAMGGVATAMVNPAAAANLGGGVIAGLVGGPGTQEEGEGGEEAEGGKRGFAIASLNAAQRVHAEREQTKRVYMELQQQARQEEDEEEEKEIHKNEGESSGARGAVVEEEEITPPPPRRKTKLTKEKEKEKQTKKEHEKEKEDKSKDDDHDSGQDTEEDAANNNPLPPNLLIVTNLNNIQQSEVEIAGEDQG